MAELSRRELLRAAGVLLAGAAGSALLGEGVAEALSIRKAGAVVSGLNLSGRSIAIEAPNVTVQGCDVAGGSIIAYRTADGARILGNTVSKAPGHGIWVVGATGPVVRGNTVTAAKGNGIELYGASSATVASNTCSGSVLGLHLLETTGVLVDGQVSHANLSNGIDLHTADHTEVRYCRSDHNGSPHNSTTHHEGQGILVYCSADVKVHHNRCWSNSQGQRDVRNGIGVSDSDGKFGKPPTHDVDVWANECYDDSDPTQSYAIGVAQRSSTMRRVLIHDNRGWSNVRSGHPSAPGVTWKRNDFA
jgi:parallel beta-helix repeat protein